ncbi:MAG: hypothetical protein ACFFCW_44845, partial [Candidatus Hodarchaeota archaeon]
MRKQALNFGILIVLGLILAFGMQGAEATETHLPLQVTVVTSSEFDRNLTEEIAQNIENSLEITYLDFKGAENQSDPITSEDLIGSAALWFVLTKGISLSTMDELIPIPVLTQYVADGGQVLIWAPEIAKLPLEIQEFFGVANIVDEFPQTGGPGPGAYPVFSLKVTEQTLMAEPFSFSQNETITYEGYGSIIEFDSFMEEIVRIEHITVRGNNQSVNAAAITYSHEEAEGTKWVITTTSLNPRLDLRFLQLITNVCQNTIAGSGGLPTTTTASQAVTTSETRQPEPNNSQDRINIPVKIASVKTQTAVAVAAISSLAILGAAVKAASIPPPIWGKSSLKDFLKRLLWYLLYPLIWIFGHVIFDPVCRRLKKDNVTTNRIRQRILQLLEERGVAYLREIERAVGSGIFGLMWHLQVLDDFGYIRHMRIGKYQVYYLKEYARSDTPSPELGFLLKNENARNIINYIMSHPGTYQAEIARKFSLHHESVRYHLLQMKEKKLVESFSDGRITRYFILDGK